MLCLTETRRRAGCLDKPPQSLTEPYATFASSSRAHSSARGVLPKTAFITSSNSASCLTRWTFEQKRGSSGMLSSCSTLLHSCANSRSFWMEISSGGPSAVSKTPYG